MSKYLHYQGHVFCFILTFYTSIRILRVALQHNEDKGDIMKILLILIIMFSFTACEFDAKDGDSKKGSPENAGPRKPDSSDDEPTPTPIPEPTPEPPVSNLPTCKKYCERNHFEDLIDDGYSYLSFTNFGHRGVGRCRGHALITQKMSMLAEFIPGTRCNLENENCLAKYKKSIDDITEFKTAKFVGFKNLFDLSRDPRLKRYLRHLVSMTSHRYRAVQGYMATRPYATEQMNMFVELTRRVENYQLPYVGVLGKLTGAHALLIYKKDFMNGRLILCARDPNFKTETTEACENYFYHEEGKVYFKRYSKPADLMSSFKITSDEDQRTIKYKQSLNSRCMSNSLASNLCR
jgi:hypothetical protein